MIKTNIKVTSCMNCPFSTFSLAGRFTKRLQHSCNLQSLTTEYRRDQQYTCFKTCPLKAVTNITVSI